MYPDRKMVPHVKAMWVTGLLSGLYPQGIGSLHVLPSETTSKEGFCCLGVLCEVAIRAGVELKRESGNMGDLVADHVFYNGYGQYLPPEVAKWAGLYDPEEENHDHPGCNPAVAVDEEFVLTYRERFGIEPPWSDGDVVELAELNDSPIAFDLLAGLIERNL